MWVQMGVVKEAEIGAAIERAIGVVVGVVIGARQAGAQKHRNRSPETLDPARQEAKESGAMRSAWTQLCPRWQPARRPDEAGH